MDITRYWRDVALAASQLPDAPVHYLVSLDNSEKGTTAGAVCEISDPKQVARRLVEKTHRLAKPEEAEQYREGVKRQTDELAAIEIKRKQQFAMPQELQTLVAAAAQLVQQHGEASKPARTGAR